jgi:hypothetical protein
MSKINTQSIKDALGKIAGAGDYASDYVTNKEGLTKKEIREGYQREQGSDVRILGMRPLVFAAVGIGVALAAGVAILLLTRKNIKGK